MTSQTSHFEAHRVTSQTSHFEAHRMTSQTSHFEAHRMTSRSASQQGSGSTTCSTQHEQSDRITKQGKSLYSAICSTHHEQSVTPTCGSGAWISCTQQHSIAAGPLRQQSATPSEPPPNLQPCSALAHTFTWGASCTQRVYSSDDVSPGSCKMKPRQRELPDHCPTCSSAAVRVPTTPSSTLSA